MKTNTTRSILATAAFLGAAAAAETEATTEKRTKMNYDLGKGHVLEVLKKNEGSTLNQLNELIGDLAPAETPNKMKFTNLYACVRQLKEQGVIFGTGAKKNEGLYLTKEAAEKNKPAPTVRATGKKDKNFTLEKKTDKGTWKVIDGHDDKKEGQAAFKTASSVPGSVFRLMDNTGENPKVVSTNEPKSEEKSAAKSEEKSATA